MSTPETLWSSGTSPDLQMLAYTVGDDRETDSRLLRWDILGSLGHIEALRGGGFSPSGSTQRCVAPCVPPCGHRPRAS